jgi:hypothetical protein
MAAELRMTKEEGEKRKTRYNDDGQVGDKERKVEVEAA